MSTFQVTWSGQGTPATGKIFARKRQKDATAKMTSAEKTEHLKKDAKIKKSIPQNKVENKEKMLKNKSQRVSLKIKPKKDIKNQEVIKSLKSFANLINKGDDKSKVSKEKTSVNLVTKTYDHHLVKKSKIKDSSKITSNSKTVNQKINTKIENTKEKTFTNFTNKPHTSNFAQKPKHFHQNPDTGQGFVKRKSKKEKALGNNDSQDGANNNTTANKQHSLFSEKHKNIYINANIQGKSIEEKVFSVGKQFRDLDIHKHLVSNLEKNSLSLLTSIQEKSIPVVKSGKNVLIRSQTGSGKTLTFVVPILDALVNLNPRLQRTDGLQAIIVVPNRELAMQIHEVINKLNTFQWIVAGHLCGGENRATEKARLRKGVHILVGTPGRLLDHILHTTAFNAKNVRCLVLDEADQLLNMGFMKDITRLVAEIDNHRKGRAYDPMDILKRQNNQITKFGDSEDLKSQDLLKSEAGDETSEGVPLKSPKSKDKQIILLSATLTRGIVELTEFLMKDHVYIDTLDQPASVTGDIQLIIPKSVKQEFLITFVKHRLITLSAFLISKSKEKNKTFIFMATTQMVDFHYDLFSKYLLKVPKDNNKFKMGEMVEDMDFDELNNSDNEESESLDLELFKLHGNMDQSERKDVFNRFRKCKKGVLICSDVAARGIDIPEADCIVQYTAPQSNDDYLHRVGRTGRAGKSGSALIFLTHEEQQYVSKLRNQKVFLQECKNKFLTDLADYMMEPDTEKAISALQKRFETAVMNDKELHKKACFAYSSWSRFYSSYSREMKDTFEMRNCNLGHYCTSFAIKDTPSQIAKIVRGQVERREPKRLNKKLANHEDNEELTGLEPAKKKKKIKKFI